MNNHSEEGTAVAKAKEKLEVVEKKFDKTKEKVSDNLSNMAEKIHEKSDTAQEFLSHKVENAEDVLRKKTYEAGDVTQQTLQKANELGHRAANAIDSSSEYIRNFDVSEAKQSVQNTFRENQVIGIAIAGTFGLLLGLIIGSKRAK